MGFWDAVGKVVGSALDKGREMNEQKRRVMMEFDHLSDSALFEKLADLGRQKRFAEAVGIKQLLKNRGYSDEEISRRSKAYL
ncbi:hypothetical protein [Avibacterium paragallinarum]|uniref:Uncharacterized protein n=1 Tax=Avibacterium paragallinarum TaxID=728 RepID=A0A0F5F177_AVIPA|nr:hypothetical protein [Avibacterium paragallinarum]KAA6208584.1 hypothetical protein F1968_08530 [Avibacterium paragallinarum]KKB02511.1 hypothetical protein Z012_00485 [Avibacterium paragallinarum]MEE3608478.1 hypothetical protein [Avibacterium paragallinarum]MEE3620576.1 hypothetical protein [Avibacterium paragallinarum]MEE3667916.1 hypothetical protein [Avibacterium paragallinarum]